MPIDHRLLSDVLKHWQRRLLETPAAMKFCQSKKFTAGDLERQRIGYSDGTLPTVTDQHEPLRKLGLLNPDNTEVFTGCLVLPKIGASGVLELLAAVPIKGGDTITLKLQEPTPVNSTELEDDGTLTVTVAGVTYQLRGLKYDGVDHRCLLKAVDGKVTHVDRLDLALARSRTGFARGFEQAGGPPADTVCADLLHVLAEIERAGSIQAASRQPETAELTEEHRTAALTFLKQHNLLAKAVSDLAVLGYVGEDTTKALAFLVAISRKLPSCLSLILQSSSGAGKSYLMECVSTLCPGEDVLYFSRISPQSLYYMKPGALRHKLVIVDERNGSEEADYSIRTLQTRRKLTLAIPIKDNTSGKTETKTFEVEGPIAFMESTTQAVHPENASRAFVVSLEETPAQTKTILEAQRKQATAISGHENPAIRALIEAHQNAQRLLRSLPVVIPYAQKLKPPLRGHAVKVRREHQRFLTLIQASALLHQHQRPLKVTPTGVEYIEASRDDEAVARALMDELMRRGHEEVTDAAAELLRWMQTQPDAEHTRRQMQAALSWSYRKVREAVDELERFELAVRMGRVAGQTFRYRLYKEADTLKRKARPTSAKKH